MKIFNNNINKKNKYYNKFLFFIYIIFIIFGSEIISRLSLKNTFYYFLNCSFYFTINALIICMLFLIFIVIFNNKYISSTLLTIIILFISIGTNIKIEYRGTGLTPVDFLLVSEAGEMAMGITSNHISKIIIYSSIFILISYLFIFKMQMPKIKNKNRIKNILIAIFVFYFLLILTPKWCLVKNKYDFLNWELEKNGNAKDLGGFFYFLSKCNNPIDLKTPSKNLIEETFPYISKNTNDDKKSENENPDIIFIQSESFYDIENLGLENFKEDPLPFYHNIIKESDFFYLTSPTRGGGTANAEFEVMTGIPTLFFPTDLSIYSGYLNQPTISVGSILRSQGYVSQIIHPFLGTFYRRNVVYNLFGFNDFISLDTMKNNNKNFKEKAIYKNSYYVNDVYLMNQVIEQLEKKKNKKNFIFAISMECHIPFSGNPDHKNIIYKSNFLQNTNQYKNFSEYIKILKDVDNSLRTIINYLKNTKKPTIVFFYGDHQPFFDFSIYKKTKNKPYEPFKVPAFIWSNYKKLKKIDSLLDMTSAGEKVLSTSGVKIPNYYKILKHFRTEEKIQTITSDYIIINNKIYTLETEKYKNLRKKYQIMASDILSNNKFIEKNQNTWLIQNNKEYISPVPLSK